MTMILRAALRIALLALLCLRCGAIPAADRLSYANADAVRVRSLHLDLKADFAQRSLVGFVELTLNWIDPAALSVDLDTRDLAIARVQYLDGQQRWLNAPFKLDQPDPALGQALRIALPLQASRVRIYYRTAPNASALQWLAPAQSMSGKWSMLASQSKPMHARSWIPLQDSPQLRFTYSARIDAPAGLRVLMGGEADPQANGSGGWRYSMPHPVAPSMLAIVVGELERRAIGSRSAVYAEPGRIDGAVFELDDTERMIDAAAALYGPYRWQRLDMAVLPPAFPAGSTQAARLSLFSSTVLAGDRSLASLVAQAVARSWSGSQDAHTAYVANRLLEAVYGQEAAAMQRQLDLEEPDAEGSSDAWLLYVMEQRIGRAPFDAFLRKWFDRQAYKDPTPAQFIDAVRASLVAQVPAAASEAELSAWLQGQPRPASAALPPSPRLARVDQQATDWLAGAVPSARLAEMGWSAPEWMKFLNDIDGKASAAQMADLDRSIGLSSTTNHEIAYRFYRAAIRAGYTGVRPALAKFLTGVGRLKFIEPLYTLLLAQPLEKQWVRTLYATRARPLYHPQAQAAVDMLLRSAP